MKLLVLGGTMFLGRHLVEAALRRGHEISLFNRGRHNPELFPEVEKLRGDRDDDLARLDGKTWDAVIDTCGYVPRIVRRSAAHLAASVKRYVFISTITVFADFSQPVSDENAPLSELANNDTEEVTGATYGPLKALCEQAAEEAMPGRVLTIRPGLIVGPHDTTVRFSYWTRRVARGGEVLTPGRPEKRVQIIDARDLSEWMIRMIEQGHTGIYNATGPDYELTMERLLEECRRVSGSDARFTWVGERFLLEAGIRPWSELPLWLPGEEEATHRYFLSINCAKAIAAGLRFRPLDETIRDTLYVDGAHRDVSLATDKDYGMSVPNETLRPEREREVLAAWHKRSSGAS